MSDTAQVELRSPAISARLPRGEAAFQFTGGRTKLIPLTLKVSVLTLITFGIYRFWGKTHLRKFFWNNVSVAGDPLEYTGTPGELFKGFLIAIVILAPVGMVYNAAATAALSEGFDTQALIEALYYVGLVILVQVAFYRMWKYRLSRTTWRGIRFGLTGSTLGYLWRSILWTFAFVGSLGLTYTWGRVSLWQYRLNHTNFGSQSFSFSGIGGDLVRRWIVAFYIPLALIVTYSTLEPALVKLGSVAVEGGELTDSDFDNLLRTSVVLGGLLFIWFLMMVWYRVYEFRYLVGNLHFGEIDFDLDLSAIRVIGLFAQLIAIIGLTLGVGIALLISPGGEFPAIFMFILAGVILMPMVNTVIVHFGLAQSITEGLTVSDPKKFDEILQSVDEVQSTGEGLADALDVGAF